MTTVIESGAHLVGLLLTYSGYPSPDYLHVLILVARGILLWVVLG